MIELPEQWRRAWRKSLWYQEVLFPALFGALLFGVLTYIVYAGNQRDQLASKVERILIGLTLNIAAIESEDSGAVVVISETDADSDLSNQAAPGRLKSLPIHLYAQILRRVLQEEPALVVISWIPGAHSTEAGYLAPLIAAIRARSPKTKVWVPYPIFELSSLPSAWRHEFTFLEGDHCGFDVQVMCSFNDSWDSWIIQRLVQELSEAKDPQDELPKFVSRNLPHTRPSFLLHLPKLQPKQELSFRQALAGQFSAPLQGKLVFIGSARSQLPGSGGDEALLRRVRVPGQSQQLAIEKSEPYHRWWARLAQMFSDKSTVNLPAASISRMMTVVLAFCIIVLIWKAGAGSALGIFLLYSSLYPMANIGFVKYLNIYLPVFDSIYFGLVTFLLLAFGRMSFEAHNKWLLVEKKRRYVDLADLKTNFIAMTSHNLNTPVAKMQGLIDLLMIRLQPTDLFYFDVRRQIAEMQIGVRSVLMRSSMEAGNFSRRRMTATQFWGESRSTLGGILKRLNVKLDWQPEKFLEYYEEGDPFSSFECDMRALNQVVVGIGAICASPAKESQLELSMGVDNQPDGAGFVLVLSGEVGEVAKNKLLHLCDSRFAVHEGDSQLSFFHRVNIALIRVFANEQNGEIKLSTAAAAPGASKVFLSITIPVLNKS